MPSLLDIIGITETVPIGSVDIEVGGVSAGDIARLLARFPELRAMMAGRTVELDKLIAIGGDAVAAIIAAGTRHAGEAEHEAAAARLGVANQAELLGAILRLTFPNGIAPLVEQLAAMGGGLGGVRLAAPSPKAPAGNSPSQSSS